MRAALAIQRALSEHEREEARQGARSSRRASDSNAGTVVVDSAGEVFGDAPNVAARSGRG